MLTEDLVDAAGYPTEAALDHIRSFSGSPEELADFIAEIWWPQGRGYGGPYATEFLDDRLKKYTEFALSTGGFSGNEEIVEILRDSWFWFRWWESSKRGGHYKFRVPSGEWGKRVERLGHWLD